MSVFWQKGSPNREGWYFLTEDDGDHLEVVYVNASLKVERVDKFEDKPYLGLDHYIGSSIWWCRIEPPTLFPGD